MSTPVGPPRDTPRQDYEAAGGDPADRPLVEPGVENPEVAAEHHGPQIGYTDSRPDQPWNAEGQQDVPTDLPRRRAVETTLPEPDAGIPTTRIERVDPVQSPPPVVLEQPVVQRPMVQPVAVVPDRETVVARERERFGGMKFGAGFFGWLTATGLAVLLLAILAAAGVAFGITSNSNVNQAVQQANNGTGTAKTVGLIGAIVLLVILFLAYYAGGYVAGRMARFDGFKQGLGVWLWAIITTAVIAAVAAIAGSKYNILANLNLPRIPVKEGSVTTVGIIAIAAALLAALLGALLGGKVGTRYHRKVDAAGYLDD